MSVSGKYFFLPPPCPHLVGAAASLKHSPYLTLSSVSPLKNSLGKNFGKQTLRNVDTVPDIIHMLLNPLKYTGGFMFRNLFTVFSCSQLTVQDGLQSECR